MKLRDVFIITLTLIFSFYLGLNQNVNRVIKAKLMPDPVVTQFKITGSLTDYFLAEDLIDQYVNHWYENLSPTAKVGQLIMPAWDNATNATTLQKWVKKEYIGGFMTLRKDIGPTQIANIKAQNTTKVPLLIASDAEPSLLKYRFENPPFTGETAELDSLEKIQKTGQDIATLLHANHTNLNFAPVYDRNTNTSVIGDRAFSANSNVIDERANHLSQVFIDQNIIPTAKHFPGHGLVSGDTHLGLETITGELQELPQFVGAIKNNIPVIMVGHLAVKNQAIDTQGLPATLSRDIVQSLLREQLAFEGLIITDAMNMKAVSDIPNAEIKSLQAGTDIILMPSNPESLNQAIQALMTEDPIFAAEIEQSIKRVLRLKFVWAMSEAW